MRRLINNICEDYMGVKINQKRSTLKIDYITINEWEVIFTYKENGNHYREVQKILTHEEFIKIIKKFKAE